MFVAFDFETHPISPWNKAPKPVVMSWQSEVMQEPALAIADHAVDVFESLALDTPDTVFLGHNAPFDLCVLYTFAPYLKGLVFTLVRDGRVVDTQVVQKLIAIREGSRSKEKFSLSALSERYLGYPLSKGSDTWRLRYHELADVPLADWPAEAKEYSLNDARVTLQVWQAQQRLLEKYPLPQGEVERQVQAAFALQVTSLTGLRTDPKAVNDFEYRNMSKLYEHQQSLFSAGIYQTTKKGEFKKSDKGAHVRDMKAIKQRVTADFQARGMAPPMTEPSGKYPQGQVSTALEVLEQCDDPVLRSLAEISECSKLINTYLPILKSRLEHPVSCSYDSLLATGRTSSYEPNDQNPPRSGGYRECHVAPPGHVFVSVDYDMAELQAMAQILFWQFGRSSMKDAINAGKDLHCMVAANALDIPYEQAFERRKIKGTPEYKWRQLAKVVNFGGLGGMGAETLVAQAKSQHVNMTLAESQRLMMVWKRTWPELELYFAHASDVTGIFGDKKLRHWVDGREVSNLTFCQICNYPFQGLVALFAKLALFRCVWACEVDKNSPMYGGKMVLFIHDENIGQFPEDRYVPAGEEMARIMRQTQREILPDVKGGCSPSASRIWTKDWPDWPALEHAKSEAA